MTYDIFEMIFDVQQYSVRSLSTTRSTQFLTLDQPHNRLLFLAARNKTGLCTFVRSEWKLADTVDASAKIDIELIKM